MNKLMKQNHILPNEWSIIENEFHKDNLTASESIFSIGNGYMGQRANFEEDYSGDTLQGTYIGGIYYPDKTRVGWWKNGYPEYFAKVLNAPNWLGIRVKINNEFLDLNTAKVSEFYRELNMKEGWLQRKFKAELPNGKIVAVNATRFVSMQQKEIGVIKYSITPVNFDGTIEIVSYIDAGIKNQDANYDEFFWKIKGITGKGEQGFVTAETLKISFRVCTAMQNVFEINNKAVQADKNVKALDKRLEFSYHFDLKKREELTLYKYVSVTQSMNIPKNKLQEEASDLLSKAVNQTYYALLEEQIIAWYKIWKTSDIEIVGDIKAQQAIRFNIFQLNQTYTGEDARLNIGPKGFTGEKYGGSTYWDTEAYCIPFYMSTKDKQVAKNLLMYRYNQLDKAIENAEKLGFTNGAALYPMVTMNGEECHNEWEITFEEIHRNGAMVYAIYNYVNYTDDYDYVRQYGMEVIIAVARFWAQRVNFSQAKNKYVILGVTGPNEYENNVNNNWYTNYLAKWNLSYALENIDRLKADYPADYKRIISKVNFLDKEAEQWKNIVDKMYFPFDEKQNIYLQQDGFLDKEIINVSDLAISERPLIKNGLGTEYCVPAS